MPLAKLPAADPHSFHIFHSAVAEYYAPSDYSVDLGHHCECIWAVSSRLSFCLKRHDSAWHGRHGGCVHHSLPVIHLQREVNPKRSCQVVHNLSGAMSSHRDVDHWLSLWAWWIKKHATNSPQQCYLGCMHIWSLSFMRVWFQQI